MTVNEMDLVGRLKDMEPLRPEAFEEARVILRAAMAVDETGPAQAPRSRCDRRRTGGRRLAPGLPPRRLLAGVAAVAVAVAGAAGAYLASGSGSTGAPRPAATGSPKGTVGVHQKIQLVDYRGQQPRGFDVASVPQGFGLQTQVSSAFMFVLAPPGVDEQPGDSGSTPFSFVGKLVVTAETASDLGDWQSFGTRSATVNGAQARIGDSGDATQVWFAVGNGVVVDIQAWDSIGLTDQQLIDFAEGITTTPALQLSHG